LKPPDGAGPFNVTEPVELVPPVTLVGLPLRLDSLGGLTVKGTPIDDLPAEAEIIA
jgi:hypothetical protein